MVMNRQKWRVCPDIKLSHEVYCEGRDAGNGADGLFVPLTQQISWEMMRHGGWKLWVMTESSERVAHFHHVHLRGHSG